MPKFTYLGFSDEEKKARLDAMCENIRPPEKRGKDPIYHITKDDGEELRELKRKLMKEYKLKRRAELAKGLDAEQGVFTLTDFTDPKKPKPIQFPKDKPVFVPIDNPLSIKLRGLSVGSPNIPQYKGHPVVQHGSFKMEVTAEDKKYLDEVAAIDGERPAGW